MPSIAIGLIMHGAYIYLQYLILTLHIYTTINWSPSVRLSKCCTVPKATPMDGLEYSERAAVVSESRTVYTVQNVTVSNLDI